MDDIEQKALALVNEVTFERGGRPYISLARMGDAKVEALCRALEQHEATKQEFDDFKQKVSDAMKEYRNGYGIPNYDRFIILAPKPDPLEEILSEIDHAAMWVDECAKEIRAALDARGLEIREKAQ